MTSGVRTFGVDVSHHDGVIDWDTALCDEAPGKIHYCFVKASQLYMSAGKVVRQLDPQFDRNWDELGRLEIPRGAFHYCIPDFSAAEMADLFFEVYAPESGDLIPTMDIEDEYVRAIGNGNKSKAQLVDQILQFGEILKTRVGKNPFIYIRKDIAELLGSPTEFQGFPLWIANYNNPTVPPLPKPWPTYTLWQYSEKGQWPGVPESSPGKPGLIDFNYLNGPPDILPGYKI